MIGTAKMWKNIASVLGAVLVGFAAYLFVPPAHQASAQYADQGTWAGTSGGTANAQTITVANLSGNKAGIVLRFIPGGGLTNTGPTTINVNGFGAVAVQRPSSLGLVAFSGQEFWAGEPTCVMYNGSVYVLGCNVDMTPIGKTIEFRGTTAPRGSLIEDGSCVSQSTYAALFSVIGTNYGSCSAGLFKLPFSNGTAFVANDNQGANGAANRITSAGSGCAATSVGTLCGQQNNSLLLTNLPPITPAGTISGTVTANLPPLIGGVTAFAINVGAGPINIGGTGSGGTELSLASVGVPASFSGSFTGTTGGGSSTAFTNLMPIMTGIRAIKY